MPSVTPTAADLLDSLTVEIRRRADRGQATPPAAVALVRADVADAAMHGDQDRLAVLQAGLDRLLDEAATFYSAGPV